MNLLENILNDLNLHSGRNKEELLEGYVRDRLEKSLRNYYDSLMKSAEYLSERKNKLKVMKNINKD